MIAGELAKRDRVQIMPTGHTAENILGLSTQVPLVLSFLTTGSTRTVKIGNCIIRFRHAAPRNFAYQGKTIPLIVQTFKELGTANIGEAELNIVADYLSNAPDKETHASDLLMAPIWIQKIVKPLLQKQAL